MIVKSKKLMFLKQILGKIDTSNLSSENIKSLVRLDKSINQESDVIGETQKRILSDYDIKPNQMGNYDWNNHENAEEISFKINDLLLMEVNIEPTEFMEEDRFYDSIKGLQIAEISLLEDVVVIKTE